MKNYFVIIFFILIFLPLTALPYTAHFQYEPNEARKLTTLPNIHLLFSQPTAFKTYFDNYLSDRIFFRSLAIKLHNYLYVRFFKSSPSSKVLIGQNGWLYYAGDDVFDDFTGKKIFSKDDLAKIKTNLERKKEWCDKNQSFFLFIITPNKETIYPEYLPTNIIPSTHGTKLDQVVNYLKNNHSKVEILDLREVLLKNKSKRLLFQRTDSHWNHYGAYLAYKEIINKLEQNFPYVYEDMGDTLKFKTQENSGDLARMLFLNDYFVENIPVLDESTKQTPPAEYQIDSLSTAIFFRDSFADLLIPFISKHFKQITYPLAYASIDFDFFDKNIIAKNKPDVVIYQITERSLAVLVR